MLITKNPNSMLDEIVLTRKDEIQNQPVVNC